MKSHLLASICLYLSLSDAFSTVSLLVRQVHSSITLGAEVSGNSKSSVEDRFTYNLGLGKNPPVGGCISSTHHIVEAMDALRAVQFLEEHCAVVEYPSPLKRPQVACVPRKATRYNLGLGKNPPLVSTGKYQIQVTNPFDAVKYLEEYEGAVEFPSPLAPQHPYRRDLGFSSSSSSSTSTGHKKPPMHIKPLRFSIDLIDIYELQYGQRGGSSTATVAYSHPHGNGKRHHPWDVNTPWVEMLIHEQQQLVAVH